MNSDDVIIKILLAAHVGEIARLLITPLQHPVVSRLHPAMVNRNNNRQ